MGDLGRICVCFDDTYTYIHIRNIEHLHQGVHVCIFYATLIVQIHNNTPAVPNVIVAIKDSYNQGTQGFPSVRKPFEANAKTHLKQS